MKCTHRGYELSAVRDKAMGGWTNTYYYAMRKRDRYMLIESFSEGDSPKWAIKWMKRVIDALKDKCGGRVNRLDEAIDIAYESEVGR